ncbi:hypothetical protein G7054_g1355 [Neopestalotiopsis clavispora]|nr:hypothetical protein G7054_g1355 [Neopestalotiopsis clavispora]
MTPQSSSTDASHITAEILIVGGGFGGCYALHQFRSLGYSVKLIEAGSDFGGVWHFNRYPGARVDSETPLYQLSLPPAWSAFNFKERFPDHQEIRAYFKHMTTTLNLRKDAIFNERVVGASFDQNANEWTLRTANETVAKSRFVIFATGTTNKPYIPSFPGLDTFPGEIIHPAAWPEELDVTGKRIGIVGQGASGLQILQSLAREDCELTVFIRNPPTALPMAQRSLSYDESEEQKNVYDALFTQAKHKNHSGYAYSSPAKSYYDALPEERKELYEKLWRRGTYAILTSSYAEHSYDKTANAELYRFWAEKTRARITDPYKRDIMAPLAQFQWIGAKRPNLEMDYYEMVDRPNVKLVDLKQEPIKHFTESGIVTSRLDVDETHGLDVVIVATGYDSVTGSLFEMNITDKNGTSLQEKWKRGILTYLGMMIPDVPNAFMLYGPQAPSGLANGPPFLELQVDWLVKLFRKIEQEQLATIEACADAAQAYKDKNQTLYVNSLVSETPSWWNGSNIPGKTKEPLFWVGGLQGWIEETLKALEASSNFVVSQKQ